MIISIACYIIKISHFLHMAKPLRIMNVYSNAN
jgi:hypothetical protein